ncbi:TspO/MBR-related protein [Pseudomassariella vexata]|uniref:TspO/MBR-related protein n=1 Tax=Pseudomassariella vexata TaxID=1141098 RepID=A0A1Y2E345_9PEZI|nr:TspO/MBR-related protein [Pseudomassariella vexata]ORY65970.1 TspO/MBR-related protein [Pseudomassariella vexata]
MTTYIPQITIPHAVFANPAASVLLPIALGTGVGFSTRPKDTQNSYMLMKQPPLRPPPYVFGPVWTLLYGLMGYAAHRAITAGMNPLTSSVGGVRDAKHAATLYSVQLGLNLIWMPLFFGVRKPVLALADIAALVGVNGYLTYLFFQLDNVAGWCMAPYMGWLGFATYLNAALGHLNDWKISDEDLRKKKN